MVPPGISEQQQMSKNAPTICLKDNSTFWPTNPHNQFEKKHLLSPLCNHRIKLASEIIWKWVHISTTPSTAWCRTDSMSDPKLRRMHAGMKGNYRLQGVLLRCVYKSCDETADRYQKWRYLIQSLCLFACKKARHPMLWSEGRTEGRKTIFIFAFAISLPISISIYDEDVAAAREGCKIRSLLSRSSGAQKKPAVSPSVARWR